MVSSKCSHSENPCCRAISLQALIPPCAQTECERLTGTIEKRSTSTPSSASLMVQASPASPPPTTMTRFFAFAIISPHLFSHRRAFCVEEFQVMFQVTGRILDELL